MLLWLGVFIIGFVVLALNDAGFTNYLLLGIASFVGYRASQAHGRVKELEEKIESLRGELLRQISSLAEKFDQLAKKQPAEESAFARAAVAEQKISPAAPPVIAAVTTQAVEIGPSPVRATSTIAEMFPNSVASAQPPLRFSQIGSESEGDWLDGIRSRAKSILDFEVWLGTNWLSKLGIFILVLGIAFFLAWEVRTFGPAGKDAVGFLTALALIGVGVWGERTHHYQLLARAAVAGGWALLFFVSYAIYHVPAARVLASPSADLAVMLLVAGMMVAHTLRYRSQTVTCLAFLTAFTTLILNRADVYSLTANVVLAIALIIVVLRMHWYQLEIFGLLGVYLAHYYWLRPIIEPMHGHRHSFPEFLPSAAILVCYWAAFRVCYLIRDPKGDEKISTFAALLNTALLLAVLKYQSVHPEWAFWALLVMGAVEIGLGQLPIAQRRRLPFIVLTTIGAAQLLAAIPFRYGPQYVSSIWLVEAEALFALGLLTRERVFRILGMLAGVALGAQMLAVDAARVYGARSDGAYVVREPVLGSLFYLAAALMLTNSLWAPRRWPEAFGEFYDKLLVNRLTYVAAVLAFVAGWIIFPVGGAAVLWITTAAGLVWLGSVMGEQPLTIQGSAIALFALIRALIINLHLHSQFHAGGMRISVRLISTGIVAALFYLSARWTRTEHWSLTRRFPAAFTWAASTLVSLLLWYELRPSSVAMSWGLFGLILLEIGITRPSLNFRVQGFVALGSSFLRIFFVDLNGSSALGEINSRVYTVVPLCAAFAYAYWRIADCKCLSYWEERLRVDRILCYFATISFLSLLRFETPLDWVVTAFAAMVPVLMVLAWRTGEMIFREQAVLVCLASLFRGITHNFYERSYFHAPLRSTRILCVGSAVLLVLCALPLARRLRSVESESTSDQPIMQTLHSCFVRSDLSVFYMGVLLLTILLGVEMRHGIVTVAWGIEGVLLFLFALWIGERSYRITGLCLLLLCVGKIALVDVWRLNTPDRALTFIVLGAALLMVSLLYTRNREAIRQFL